MQSAGETGRHWSRWRSAMRDECGRGAVRTASGGASRCGRSGARPRRRGLGPRGSCGRRRSGGQRRAETCRRSRGAAAARAGAEPGSHGNTSDAPQAPGEESRPRRLAGPSCEPRDQTCQWDGSRRGAQRRLSACGQQEPSFSARQLNPARDGARNRGEIYYFIARTSLPPESEFEQPALDFIFASPQTKVSRVALAFLGRSPDSAPPCAMD